MEALLPPEAEDESDEYEFVRAPLVSFDIATDFEEEPIGPDPPELPPLPPVTPPVPAGTPHIQIVEEQTRGDPS